MDWPPTLALGDDLRLILEVAGAVISAILGALGGGSIERRRPRSTSTRITRETGR